MHATDDGLLDALRELGHPVTGLLGAGMEGTVVGLADGTVVKVWAARSAEDLRRQQAFYDSVHAAGFRLGVPRILDVLEVAGRQATRQPRLEGEPLWGRPGESPPADDAHVDAVAEVLDALAALEPAPAMAALPVLDGEPPFDPGLPFGQQLAGLVERRVARHETMLAGAVPDLAAVVAAVTGLLRALPASPLRLLHGDLVPGNVLVQDGKAAAVLDFGFLSTLGDPAFDAAVTSSIYDMYGPDAARSEARLERALGHDGARLRLYRAAYALVTACCFSASGSDGHFAWCVRMLARPDVREAVGLSGRSLR